MKILMSLFATLLTFTTVAHARTGVCSFNVGNESFLEHFELAGDNPMEGEYSKTLKTESGMTTITYEFSGCGIYSLNVKVENGEKAIRVSTPTNWRSKEPYQRSGDSNAYAEITLDVSSTHIRGYCYMTSGEGLSKTCD